MIKPWVFEFFHALDFFSADATRAESAAQINEHFDWYMDLWARDEALGYEGIFFSEHHFGGGYSPSPNLMVAALAARTKTMRLGTLGAVAPYATPWRVVEEIGMLDHLTHGRLDIGIVRGLGRELAAVGIGAAEAAERYAEIVEVMDKALGSPTVSHEGKHWRFKDLKLVPPTLQQPPPVWTAVTSTSSSEWAGRRGVRICAGFFMCPKIKSQFDAYRAGAESAGRTATPDNLGIRRQVRIVQSEADVAEARRDMRHTLLGVQQSGIHDGGPKLLDSEMIAQDDEFIAGTADNVAEQIIEQCRATGAGHFLACFYESSRGEISRNHETFATRVIPQLRRASVG